jgi:hypothetical protein
VADLRYRIHFPEGGAWQVATTGDPDAPISLGLLDRKGDPLDGSELTADMARRLIAALTHCLEDK